MEKVLLVDDEPNVLNAFKRRLTSTYEFYSATSAAEALKILEQAPDMALIVSDMNMPGMNGSDFLKIVAKQYPNTIRIMLTGLPDQRTALRAINDGEVYRFLTKPCSAQDFEDVLQASAVRYQLERQERDLLQNTLGGTVALVTDLVSLVDPHGTQRAGTMRKIAREVFVGNAVPLFELELAIMMSGLGRLSLPLQLLMKCRDGGSLSPTELTLLNQSSGVTARLLKHIPRLEKIALLIQAISGEVAPTTKSQRNSVLAYQIVLQIFQEAKESEGAVATLKRISPTLTAEQRELLAGSAVKAVAASVASAPDRFEVALSELIPGQTLLEDVCDSAGKLLLKKGAAVSEAVIVRLKNHEALAGVRGPFVVDTRIPTG